MHVSSPHPTNELQGIHIVRPLVASEWRCTSLQTLSATDCFPCYLCAVLASLAAIHLAYWLASLTILADQRGTRRHVHPCCKKSRKEENKFSSTLRNPQGHGPMGNQESLDIMKRFLEHLCDLGGATSKVCTHWLKVYCDSTTHRQILFCFLAFPGKLPLVKWDLQDSNLTYGPEWTKETTYEKIPKRFYLN